MESIATGLGDCADHAAQCTAVFGIESSGLDLYFLEIVERRSLACRAVDHAVYRNTIDVIGVLSSAGAVNLVATIGEACIDRRRKESSALERAAFREQIQLFCSYVRRERSTARIDHFCRATHFDRGRHATHC